MNPINTSLITPISTPYHLSILKATPISNDIPEAYKIQKHCKVCFITLKITKLHSRQRLHQCKFCYNAVCDPCSTLKLFHPCKQSDQRICISCVNSTIKKVLKSNCEQEILTKKRSSFLLLQKEKQEIFAIQKDLGCIIDLVDTKSSELLVKQEEIKGLKLDLDIEEDFIRNNEEKVRLIKLLQRENEELCELSEKFEVNFRVLDGLKNKIRDLESEEKELKLGSQNEVIKSDCLEVLEIQISNLWGLANTYKHDIEKIRAGKYN